MCTKGTEEFRSAAVRIALRSGLLHLLSDVGPYFCRDTAILER